MLISTSTARTFKLSWMHSAPPDGLVRKDPGANRLLLDEASREIQRRITVCTVREFGDNAQDAVIVGEGVALCHPTDAFSKSVGRKLSLTYALGAAKSTISRDERAELWTAYLDQFGR